MLPPGAICAHPVIAPTARHADLAPRQATAL
jgi:hypothetical protein